MPDGARFMAGRHRSPPDLDRPRLPAPAHVRRERVLQDGFQHTDVPGQRHRHLGAEPFVEGPQRDRLPHSGPPLVPGLEARGRETPRDRLRVRTDGAEEQLVRERVALEVQAELDDLAPAVYAALVVQILVAEPELDHPAGGKVVWRGGVAELTGDGAGQA